MYSTELAIIFVVCFVIGIFRGNRIMRETKEGIRPAAEPVKNNYICGAFFWID